MAPTQDAAHGVAHMKWWGWGEESVSFSHEDKPALADFVLEAIGIDCNSGSPVIPTLKELPIGPGNVAAPLRAALEAAVGADHVTDDPEERVVHTYGKSLRDLVRLRAKDLGRLPDVVVYPADEDQVANVLRAALEHNAVLIPFGGGTNISGSLEAPRTETRTVISLDMGRLDAIVSLDAESRTAVIQAGALGPDLEAQLNTRGWTIGHFPDSFNHSTLGGWIATRSSGMQSDKYGDIADLTRGVRVVTPNGLLNIRPVPSTSTGPSVREMILGSEGRLGVITEATVHIHRLPEQRVILGYLFPTWAKGLDAMQAIAASDATPSVTRISDAAETAFSFATKKAGGRLDDLQSKALKVFLTKQKGFDLDQMCLSFIGFEGGKDHVKRNRELVGDIVKAHGGLCVGSGPGELYDQKKFDTPYIRDFLLDRGGLADVSETSAPWSRLSEVYVAATDAVRGAYEELGVHGYVMCHLSHSYHSGACLYFTFAFKATDADDPLKQYDVVKRALQQSFMDHGGTLSHHHAVGVEHREWLAQDISEPGVAMVRALFNGVDPARNLNPGKIVEN
jgi:alkyldihydroxyacetonephosphate synthase